MTTISHITFSCYPNINLSNGGKSTKAVFQLNCLVNKRHAYQLVSKQIWYSQSRIEWLWAPDSTTFFLLYKYINPPPNIPPSTTKVKKPLWAYLNITHTPHGPPLLYRLSHTFFFVLCSIFLSHSLGFLGKHENCLIAWPKGLRQRGGEGRFWLRLMDGRIVYLFFFVIPCSSQPDYKSNWKRKPSGSLSAIFIIIRNMGTN